MVKEMLEPRHPVTSTENRIEFDLISSEGAGFSFPADSNWNPVWDPEYESIQKENYEYCTSHPELFNGPFEKVIRHTWTEPAKAVCECGSTISLTDEYRGASQCPECGIWHNMFGQTLLDPDYWADENNDDYYGW